MKVTFRLPRATKAGARVCKEYAQAAIDAAVDDFGAFLTVFKRAGTTSRARKASKGRVEVSGNPLENGNVVLDEVHLKRLISLINRLTKLRKKGAITKTPNKSNVMHSLIQMHYEANQRQVSSPTQSTREFLEKPALVSCDFRTRLALVSPFEENLRGSCASPGSFDQGAVCLIDATVLLAATIRQDERNQVEPISVACANLIGGAIKGSPRLLLHRGETEKYVELLWAAIRGAPDMTVAADAAKKDSLNKEGKTGSDREEVAKAYVREKYRLLMESAIELFDIDPESMFDATLMPEKIPLLTRAQVSAARKIASGGVLALMSVTRGFLGFASIQKEKGLCLLHPNDLNCLSKADYTKQVTQGPNTARWIKPLSKESIEAESIRCKETESPVKPETEGCLPRKFTPPKPPREYSEAEILSELGMS